MSMLRQLWLSILISALIGLGASLVVALVNARGYLEEQLSMKNRDNAVTLAIGLSQSTPDVDDVILAVTAQFNSGQYEAIQFMDPTGKILIEKKAPEDDLDVPAWFMSWLKIQPAPGKASVTSGWNQLGSLTLLSHSHFAYQSLWNSARTMTLSIVLAGLLGGILVSLVMLRIRKPLRAVIEQARAISERRFVTIPEPNVPELKQLAEAMNESVERMREMLQEDAVSCEDLRRKANQDALTGLFNREFFMASLDDALDKGGHIGCCLAILRLSNLTEINRIDGREVADEALKRSGQVLATLSQRIVDARVARMSGGDFAILLPSQEHARKALQELMSELQAELLSLTGKPATLVIGHAELQSGEGLSTLLARVDAALANAEASGKSQIQEAGKNTPTDLPANAEEWRYAIHRALRDKGNLKLVHHAVREHAGEGEVDECPLRIRIEGQGDWLPAGLFMGQAERLGLVQELDLAAVAMALDELDANPGIGGLWIFISARSVASEEFRKHLLALLRKQPEACRRLWLEAPESAALQKKEALRSLISELKPLGCHIGLEHYGHRFDQVGFLYELGLDFLKIDAGFTRGIDSNPGNQAFLAGLRDITEKIGILLYAEGVETDAELRKLEELGFDGVTGAAISQS